jgi:uncharacterized protein
VPRSVRPIDGAPALRVERPRSALAVVIADLHLGLASGPERPRGPPGGDAAELAEQLRRLCERVGARELVVAGDVKHPIVGAPPWLRPVIFDFFAYLLESGIRTEVVLGNHDVGLARFLPKEVVVHPATGLLRGSVGLFHGHRWPSAEVLAARTLVAGHLHPGFRFAPTASSPGDKQPCWVRVRFDPAHPPPGPGRAAVRARQLIVLPAFHPLAGTESLNRERPERGRSFLYGRFLARGEPRAYLLDGTDLGPIPTPVPLPRRGLPGRAARRR